MNDPESLLDICLEYLSSHLELLKDAALSQELSEALVHRHTLAGRDIDASFGRIFADARKTKLRYVSFRGGKITAEGLNYILQHECVKLDFSWCERPPPTLLKQISCHGSDLKELAISSWKMIDHDVGFENSPNLRALSIFKFVDFGMVLSLPALIKPLKNLVSLNLCYSSGILQAQCLESLPSLRRLYLHGIIRGTQEEMPDTILALRKLNKLTHLDISSISEEIFASPDNVLAALVEDLPNLVYLDISGTNLAGRGVINRKSTNVTRTDIIGLKSRVDRPLEFLGLYDATYSPCRRKQIPAKVITGDNDCSQLLQAATTYIHRPKMLERILNDIYNAARDVELKPPHELFVAVLNAMERHVSKKMVQISGSASLFFVVKTKSDQLSIKERQRIIRILLNGMEAHKEDQFMLRNCCLCLCQFKIPQDLMFEYKRTIELLLFTTTEMIDTTFVQRIAIYLLNSLACQVDGVYKHMIGEAGAVQKMLQLIDKRLTNNLCDDVMEVAWSTLWNVTDETAINCQHFLDWDGMTHFCSCITKFPDKPELLRNMMGLLGNVAEVPSLRNRLMTEHYVTVFVNLLISESDGIEVSYNATGVLAHMCSDGVEAWNLNNPDRRDVLLLMRNAISRWDLYAERNINYRSFEPILGLLNVYHTPECQHWAAWALANLTLVYPSRYCELVEKEGGLAILERVADTVSPVDYPKVPELCRMVINNCARFKSGIYQDVNLEG